MFNPDSSEDGPPPGLRALAASGDGFWELDLTEGTAWYSDWFYRRLGWMPGVPRTTLEDLQPSLSATSWDLLLIHIRGSLERSARFDLELCVNLRTGSAAPWSTEFWHMRGSATLNDTGQPVFLAGSMRDVSDELRDRSEVLSSLLSLRGAFDVMPVAAALIDASDGVLEANRLWRNCSELEIHHAMMQLRAVPSSTVKKVVLDYTGQVKGQLRQLRLRAFPFHHDGAPCRVVTLDDRTAKVPAMATD